jgi:hypothetical protein
MRVEIFDSNGNRYTITLEGQITREKALQLFDLVELLGGIPTTNNTSNTFSTAQMSKYDKIRYLVEKKFPLVWFSSKEIQAAYEEEFKEPITLSTVATYLARLFKRGFLTRTGPSNRLQYRMLTVTPNLHVLQRK